ncbi:hypothetical protein [Lysobacter capsici]|uniref:hypothetical protein n=1 Tax=Lysobacter capsici TaxID=435897 RepID=UPI003CCDF4A5
MREAGKPQRSRERPSPNPLPQAGEGFLCITMVWSGLVWSGVVSVIAFALVKLVVGLRVPEEAEREGLDITTHGETPYEN